MNKFHSIPFFYMPSFAFSSLLFTPSSLHSSQTITFRAPYSLSNLNSPLLVLHKIQQPFEHIIPQVELRGEQNLLSTTCKTRPPRRE